HRKYRKPHAGRQSRRQGAGHQRVSATRRPLVSHPSSRLAGLSAVHRERTGTHALTRHMQIGLLLGNLTNARALGTLANEAEHLAFASLWAGDHIPFPGPILDPLQLLACFASHTERVRLGTCVYLLALRHPTTVAKMVASLDFISGGRITFGIGVGGEFP